MEGVIGFIGFCAAVFGIFYLHFTTRHKERLALIENGGQMHLSLIPEKRGGFLFRGIK